MAFLRGSGPSGQTPRRFSEAVKDSRQWTQVDVFPVIILPGSLDEEKMEAEEEADDPEPPVTAAMTAEDDLDDPDKRPEDEVNSLPPVINGGKGPPGGGCGCGGGDEDLRLDNSILLLRMT